MTCTPDVAAGLLPPSPQDVVGALEIDTGALLARAQDDEGDVDDAISLGDQRIEGIPVQDVALLVFGPGPSVLGCVKRAAAPSR